MCIPVMRWFCHSACEPGQFSCGSNRRTYCLALASQKKHEIAIARCYFFGTSASALERRTLLYRLRFVRGLGQEKPF
jgi:hypothetical protein